MVHPVPVPMLDLKAEYATIKAEVNSAVLSVLKSQSFIMGPHVQKCEERIAKYCHCNYGIGVSSGSDALLISLMAENIGPGDQVITTPYTFFATGGAISRLGATPVFVDICPQTYNLDVRQIETKVNDRTKAIITVHLFGQCAEMDPILEIAQRHSLVVIEDAAQAIGAEYKGHPAGSMGHYGCFSFFPSKNLGCAGDGGMVVTQDQARSEKLKSLRLHGSQAKHYHSLVGGNFRLDAIQAAVLNVKTPKLTAWNAIRRAHAQHYQELFQQAGVLGPDGVQLPLQMDDRRHIYHQFVIRVPKRNPLRNYLREQLIETAVYYPVPLHLQECFLGLGYQEGDFPESERAARETLALPVFPQLSDVQLRHIVHSICDFLK